MSFYFTYVLKSELDGNYYVGYTKNLNVRFDQHNKGEVTSTKNRRPFNLIYYEACKSQADALKREKYLKTFYGKMFIAKRLKSYFTSQEERSRNE
jgi:putative endonuclease